jgi:hypothetical protein
MVYVIISELVKFEDIFILPNMVLESNEFNELIKIFLSIMYFENSKCKSIMYDWMKLQHGEKHIFKQINAYEMKNENWWLENKIIDEISPNFPTLT